MGRCDTWMNIHLREVICTSKVLEDARVLHSRGNTIKYLRALDEVIDKVQEDTNKSRSDRKPPGVGRGRGRSREDGGSGRAAKGIRRSQDDGGSKGMGVGRGRGAIGSKGGGERWRTFVADTELRREGTMLSLVSFLCFT